jgi:His-Xaa-Ser system protein HxsD
VTTRELCFDRAAHSVDAIQRAAYRFSDRLSLDLVAEDTVYRCHIHFDETDEYAINQVLADFRKEVLDQTLRERIRAETQEVRNLILALAFSNTGLAVEE